MGEVAGRVSGQTEWVMGRWFRNAARFTPSAPSGHLPHQGEGPQLLLPDWGDVARRADEGRRGSAHKKPFPGAARRRAPHPLRADALQDLSPPCGGKN